MPPSSGNRPSVGRVLLGLTVMMVWAGAHVVLLILLGAGGVVTDVLLTLVKGVMFPGAPRGSAEMAFPWVGMLQAGTFLAGAAGVPAGLAVMRRDRRSQLMRYFWLALLVGIVCEVIAVVTFIANALSVPG